jgi:hypothetical protein
MRRESRDPSHESRLKRAKLSRSIGAVALGCGRGLLKAIPIHREKMSQASPHFFVNPLTAYKFQKGLIPQPQQVLALLVMVSPILITHITLLSKEIRLKWRIILIVRNNIKTFN